MNRAIFFKTITAIALCVGLGVAAGLAVAAPDDSVITAKVISALVDDRSVSGFDIKVETEQGLVSLSGTVDSQSQIDRAVTIARQIEGVHNVNNRMRVTR